MRLAITAVATLCVALSGCAENSDGSDATTYSSCSISSSRAILAADRAQDVAQCWDGVDYEEESIARNWCETKVNDYMARYTFGHEVTWAIASTNCP